MSRNTSNTSTSMDKHRSDHDNRKTVSSTTSGRSYIDESVASSSSNKPKRGIPMAEAIRASASLEAYSSAAIKYSSSSDDEKETNKIHTTSSSSERQNKDNSTTSSVMKPTVLLNKKYKKEKSERHCVSSSSSSSSSSEDEKTKRRPAKNIKSPMKECASSSCSSDAEENEESPDEYESDENEEAAPDTDDDEMEVTSICPSYEPLEVERRLESANTSKHLLQELISMLLEGKTQQILPKLVSEATHEVVQVMKQKKLPITCLSDVGIDTLTTARTTLLYSPKDALTQEQAQIIIDDMMQYRDRIRNVELPYIIQELENRHKTAEKNALIKLPEEWNSPEKSSQRQFVENFFDMAIGSMGLMVQLPYMDCTAPLSRCLLALLYGIQTYLETLAAVSLMTSKENYFQTLYIISPCADMDECHLVYLTEAFRAVELLHMANTHWQTLDPSGTPIGTVYLDMASCLMQTLEKVWPTLCYPTKEQVKTELRRPFFTVSLMEIILNYYPSFLKNALAVKSTYFSFDRYFAENTLWEARYSLAILTRMTPESIQEYGTHLWISPSFLPTEVYMYLTEQKALSLEHFKMRFANQPRIMKDVQSNYQPHLIPHLLYLTGQIDFTAFKEFYKNYLHDEKAESLEEEDEHSSPYHFSNYLQSFITRLDPELEKARHLTKWIVAMKNHGDIYPPLMVRWLVNKLGLRNDLLQKFGIIGKVEAYKKIRRDLMYFNASDFDKKKIKTHCHLETIENILGEARPKKCTIPSSFRNTWYLQYLGSLLQAAMFQTHSEQHELSLQALLYETIVRQEDEFAYLLHQEHLADHFPKTNKKNKNHESSMQSEILLLPLYALLWVCQSDRERDRVRELLITTGEKLKISISWNRNQAVMIGLTLQWQNQNQSDTEHENDSFFGAVNIYSHLSTYLKWLPMHPVAEKEQKSYSNPSFREILEDMLNSSEFPNPQIVSDIALAKLFSTFPDNDLSHIPIDTISDGASLPHYPISMQILMQKKYFYWKPTCKNHDFESTIIVWNPDDESKKSLWDQYENEVLSSWNLNLSLFESSNPMDFQNELSKSGYQKYFNLLRLEIMDRFFELENPNDPEKSFRLPKSNISLQDAARIGQCIFHLSVVDWYNFQQFRLHPVFWFLLGQLYSQWHTWRYIASDMYMDLLLQSTNGASWFTDATGLPLTKDISSEWFGMHLLPTIRQKFEKYYPVLLQIVAGFRQLMQNMYMAPISVHNLITVSTSDGEDMWNEKEGQFPMSDDEDGDEEKEDHLSSDSDLGEDVPEAQSAKTDEPTAVEESQVIA
jgi:hypothetical protein